MLRCIFNDASVNSYFVHTPPFSFFSNFTSPLDWMSRRGHILNTDMLLLLLSHFSHVRFCATP